MPPWLLASESNQISDVVHINPDMQLFLCFTLKIKIKLTLFHLVRFTEDLGLWEAITLL
jgi:hypothetical protein